MCQSKVGCKGKDVSVEHTWLGREYNQGSSCHVGVDFKEWLRREARHVIAESDGCVELAWESKVATTPFYSLLRIQAFTLSRRSC